MHCGRKRAGHPMRAILHPAQAIATGRPRFLRVTAVVCAGVLGWIGTASASPSGLNNIPTADTCPDQTLVLQSWAGFGYDMSPDYWSGMKYGLFDSATLGSAEAGADWDMRGDPSRPPVFQAKYAIGICQTGPRIAVGVANVATDNKLDGDPMPYAVLSYDIQGLLRVHAGYGFQNNNEGAFGGLDRTIDLGGVSLMLCGDIIQTDYHHDALLAPGIKIGVPGCKSNGVLGTILRNTSLETWVNLPSTGNAESYVVKLDYAIHF